VMFCPADDSNDRAEELPKLERRADEDAFCSYLYRQLDETAGRRLDALGVDAIGIEAEALATDINSYGFVHRTNHRGRKVNILYRGGHVMTVSNREHPFSLRAQDYAAYPTSIDRRLDEIVCAMDFAELGDPRQTPPLP
jgi:hypothetical protein